MSGKRNKIKETSSSVDANCFPTPMDTNKITWAKENSKNADTNCISTPIDTSNIT